MAEEEWVNNHCLEEPDFPKLLFVCMDRLGIYKRPEYSSKEYKNREILRCEMIIYVERSSRFRDIQPWNVSATSFRHEETYQVASWKACVICARFMRIILAAPRWDCTLQSRRTVQRLNVTEMTAPPDIDDHLTSKDFTVLILPAWVLWALINAEAVHVSKQQS